MQTIIEARGIEKSFGTLKVLKGIDLTGSNSEVLSIMGASGAGKSTLLQILGTLSTPDAGSLSIGGIDVLRLNSRLLSAFRNTKVGFVFQFHHLLPEFTALENIMIPALIAGKSRAEARTEAEALLSELGLAERAAHKPSELSGGEQQRVAIARALINHPDVIFADPPYAKSAELFRKLLADSHFTEFAAGALLIWEIPDMPGSVGLFLDTPRLAKQQLRKFGGTDFLLGEIVA